MYTRLITWTNATNIDGGIEYLRGTALPVVRQQKGYRGLSATVDRSTGRMHILSIWQSEADRDASDSALGKARDEGTEIIGGEMKVEKLEELVSEVVDTTCARVSPHGFAVQHGPGNDRRESQFLQERNRAPDQSCPRLLFPCGTS